MVRMDKAKVSEISDLRSQISNCNLKSEILNHPTDLSLNAEI